MGVDASVPRGSGGCSFFGTALAVAAVVTVWWGFVGLATENFGSDCLFYLGADGPRAEHCNQVNDRAEAWLPWLVFTAWASAVPALFVPRRFPSWRYAAVGVAVGCLVVAVVLGGQAMTVGRP
ncbi:hypothetical protein ITI46_10085 [Streptomyces oryzae]|uniref:Integral membrane protein n=1 Tax=Streptomyces oryzae TaxID=1434886 RepID=A0ABS3X9I6_9ACTN|nr:hypothetical protein [Streptomyces oryzae]MBO8192014.1 hypothetical protein [Streptomyces oryzae]